MDRSRRDYTNPGVAVTPSFESPLGVLLASRTGAVHEETAGLRKGPVSGSAPEIPATHATGDST